MTGILWSYTWRLVLWRWTRPHAACATGNDITGPCHDGYSFRITAFAHFTFSNVIVHSPFRHEERRKPPFFARTTHKAFHFGQYRCSSLLGCHSYSEEQDTRRVNGKESALAANSEFRHRYTRYIPGIYLARQLQPDTAPSGKQGDFSCRHKFLPFIGLSTGLDVSPRLNVTQVPLHLASLHIVAGLYLDFITFILKFIGLPRKQMSNSLKRASKEVAKQIRKRSHDASDTDDSQDLAQEVERLQRVQELKKATKQKKDEEASLQRRYDEQCQANARKMKELTEKRNEYPVFLLIIIDCLVVHYN